MMESLMSRVRGIGLDVHAETIASTGGEPDGEIGSLVVVPNRNDQSVGWPRSAGGLGNSCGRRLFEALQFRNRQRVLVERLHPVFLDPSEMRDRLVAPAGEHVVETDVGVRFRLFTVRFRLLDKALAGDLSLEVVQDLLGPRAALNDLPRLFQDPVGVIRLTEPSMRQGREESHVGRAFMSPAGALDERVRVLRGGGVLAHAEGVVGT